MAEKDFPEEEEIILCTVDQILGTSITVKMDDYGNKEGVIHISEIAPGRIRNIRDYVVPNKKIACKVLAVNPASGRVDLSLRRVSAKEKKEVFDESKKEIDSYNLLKTWAGQSKLDQEIIIRNIKENFTKLNIFLQEIRENPEKIKFLKLEKAQEELLLEFVKERMKAKKIDIKKKISLSSKSQEGFIIIKQLLEDLKPIKVSYISSPFYLLEIVAEDYKEANRLLEEKLRILKENAKNQPVVLEILD